ncbi:MAG: LysR substrate-binding domain-containing protein [Pollutimonas bauzanensis]|uniref:LysR family transcriptional regulator, glycine cleavage system transcriptional activator n=1 Tax=Pollutimonas bauzanensis TaxID=658167 RepID=A0A1M5YQ54_9BURK|nr:LysR substrate-binding domain-containing protein [Pollutimonas bauzanensis]SHI14071.1 LysR family transcriptional regulator, glycine cleavage system transcriptional activator [Pollutimonas bauzanensis]
MSRLPLNTLPAFRCVAELQNLRAAADVLHLTHSAVSQQIRVLEEQLGFALFERRGRRVVLNVAGAALLRSVQSALAQLDDGVQAAAAAACGLEQRLRVTVLPSFAQRWLLPRMSRWRERHPDLALEIDASQQALDLQREGFHAAIRQGTGPWPGLVAERLFDAPMPLFVVGCAIDARRLVGQPAAALLREPLLGDREIWRRWFAAAGLQVQVTPVAEFNDMGLMLQAAEQGLGLTLARELLAADALRDGRLIKLSPVALDYETGHVYHLVYPPALRDWPPLGALRQWINDELEISLQDLQRK